MKTWRDKRLLLIFGIITAIILVIESTNNKEEEIKCTDCNIILIVTDALRQDHVGTYGYYRNTTPNIDKLAEKSIVFQNAISQATWTKPSIASLFTSTYPTRHQTYAIQGINNRGKIALPDSFNTLAEQLKQKKYKTMGYVNNAWLSPEYNLNQGFEEYKFIYPDNKLTSKINEVIEKHENEKFFLFVHYLGPHGPYTPPKPYNSLFVEKEHDYINLSKRNPKYLERKKPSKTELEYIISQYDGDIAYTDNEIGKILNLLKEKKLLDTTIIIITSDHGEELADHRGIYGHETIPYDTLIKVPLIIKIPGIMAKKRIITNQVQLIDLMPTLLNITGIRTPEGIDGMNLIPLIKGNRIESNSFSEQNWKTKHVISIRKDGLKYLYNTKTDKGMLFNLKEDPYELNELQGNNEIKKRLKKEILDYYKENLEKSVKTKHNKTVRISDETIEKLKEIGYI